VAADQPVDGVAVEAIVPATPDRWDDVVALAGANGFYSNCWCAWWLMRSKDWDDAGADGRRKILDDLVHAGGPAPGLLAYAGGEPVGWCAVGPRERYPRLQHSTKLKPVDDEEGVWAVTCFVVRRDHRRTGVATALLDAAVQFAAAHGARHVEGVPIDVTGRTSPGAGYLFTGVLSTFESAGFVEIARRGGRPIVRKGTDAATAAATASARTPARKPAPSATRPAKGGPARKPR
jgi:GNAT superfamily N-acetyltransferase